MIIIGSRLKYELFQYENIWSRQGCTTVVKRSTDVLNIQEINLVNHYKINRAFPNILLNLVDILFQVVPQLIA